MIASRFINNVNSRFMLIFVFVSFLESCKQLADKTITDRSVSATQNIGANRQFSVVANLPITPQPLPAACANPPNPIVAENCKTGTSPDQWDLATNSDLNNGFTTAYSYLPGETVQFKLKTTGPSSIRVYRVGYYQGYGARFIVQLPAIANAQVQPACPSDPVTHMVSCQNWQVSSQWTLPATQISGVYLAKIVPVSGAPGSLIPFVVRNESRAADILVQTSDANWQAYNWWGGMNLYQLENNVVPVSGAPDHALQASYDRPLSSGAGWGARSWHFNFFADHYPFIRFAERNGYNLNYCGSVDTARPERLTYLKSHRIFVSLGHDEYWSQSMRDNLESARDAGTSLAFLSANTMFEKVRFDSNYRTMTAYKQSRFTEWPADPGLTGNPLTNPDQTAYFRDGRFRHLGNIPENKLMGLLYTVNTAWNKTGFTVPARYSKLRFWRNTAVAGLTGTQIYKGTSLHMLGYELDEDVDNGFRPGGLIRLSSTHFNGKITHEPSVMGSGEDAYSGSMDHHMTLYRAPSGALVWATGTIWFSSALDKVHESLYPTEETDDVVLQQATVNMFADMKAQPASLQTNLRPAQISSDTVAPVTKILTPAGTSPVIVSGRETEVTGTATDIGGVVAAIEVSTDGGATWHPAEGTNSWIYRWTPLTYGTVNLKARAIDDSGNIEAIAPSVAANVQAAGTIWSQIPPTGLTGAATQGQLELGVRFAADVDGQISAVRFYKNHADAKSYDVHLWDEAGALLASGAAQISSATQGWIEVPLQTPVNILRGKMYSASYRTDGKFAYSANALNSFARKYTPPLKELGSAYAQGPFATIPGAYPTLQNPGLNYWVDVRFAASAGQTPRVTIFGDQSTLVQNYSADPGDIELGTRFRVDVDGVIAGIRFYKDPKNTGLHTGALWRSLKYNNTGNYVANPVGGEAQANRLAWTTFTNETPSGWQESLFDIPIKISAGQTYVATYRSRSGYQTMAFADVPASIKYNAPLSFLGGMAGANSFPEAETTQHYGVDVIFIPTAPRKSTIFNTDTSPQFDKVADIRPDKSIVPYELGMKFVSEVDGYISGIRFFRGAGNTGTQTMRLWLYGRTSAPLATASVSGVQTGWVEGSFSQPVRVLANRVYVVSYSAPTGFAFTKAYFNHPFGNLVPPLRARGLAYSEFNKVPTLTAAAPAEPGGRNGVISTTMGAYPATATESNYFVEPIFFSQLPPDKAVISSDCAASVPGAACAANTGRCNDRRECQICASWCNPLNQCLTGTLSCGITGPAQCVTQPAPVGRFCREPAGGLGKCNAAGACLLSNSDI